MVIRMRDKLHPSFLHLPRRACHIASHFYLEASKKVSPMLNLAARSMVLGSKRSSAAVCLMALALVSASWAQDIPISDSQQLHSCLRQYKGAWITARAAVCYHSSEQGRSLALLPHPHPHTASREARAVLKSPQNSGHEHKSHVPTSSPPDFPAPAVGLRETPRPILVHQSNPGLHIHWRHPDPFKYLPKYLKSGTLGKL